MLCKANARIFFLDTGGSISLRKMSVSAPPEPELNLSQESCGEVKPICLVILTINQLKMATFVSS